MKLIFEKGSAGRGCDLLPPSDVPVIKVEDKFKRNSKLNLPHVSETELSRHYTELMKRTFGVNDGFYPLGSCTMKYNPKINDDMAKLPGFADIHPLQAEETTQGALEVMALAEEYLCEITGMDNMSFQPAAGAHGEFTGLQLIKAYHEKRGDSKRDKIIVPDSAHGTNPASAAMVGFKVINVPSTDEGYVDTEALRNAVGDDTAGFMLTNPNTLGLFEANILEITNIIHQAGGLNYYDGANLNAIMGIARPGDMGFDVVHLNLHKTFSTPHGGGGPGSGPVGCKLLLSDYLPSPRIIKGAEGSYHLSYDNPDSIGRVKAFYGNFLVVVRALTYILTLGKEGLKHASVNAVLNANYMMHQLKDTYHIPFPDYCMHEFIISLEEIKKEKGVTALDAAKAMLDYGMHPPTMYFPLNVPEALMVEPTETESKETLDETVRVYKMIYEEISNKPELAHGYPMKTVIGRPDEVGAARNPVLRYVYNK